MKILRICLAQINPVVGDISGNSAKIISIIRKAAGYSADVVVFPELCLCGYPPEDLLLKPHFIDKTAAALPVISKASQNILSVVGLPWREKKWLFNAAALLYNGRSICVYKKNILPNYGVFDEKRYFAAGGTVNVVSLGAEARLGMSICEDIWHDAGPHLAEASVGDANVLVNISASPYHVRKIDEREELLSSRATESRSFVVYCNLVGGQDELVFDGGSAVFDKEGRVIARAKQFEEDIISVDLKMDELRKKSSSKKRSQRRFFGGAVEIKSLPAPAGKQVLVSSNRIERKLDPVEEVYSALLLGIRDYVSKNNFKKAVLGLSGGIDSAVTAALAVDALGRDNVTALSMPSRYTSSGTKNDARLVAGNLGIRCIVIPIDRINREYLAGLKRHFHGKPSDIAEENLQARIRGNLLMAFSNKFGWIVLTTGNKSEISTGYCTLYGDLAGGFAVLKDVPKGLVYKLAAYVNKKSARHVIPDSVIRRPPTAELRKNQKDQDTLPPYDILDGILDLYVEKDMPSGEIVRRGFAKQTVKNVISMVDRSEYKRRQAPPGIKITPKAFGKDRRMPITNAFSASLR